MKTKWLYNWEEIESYSKEELIDIVVHLSNMMNEQRSWYIKSMDLINK